MLRRRFAQSLAAAPVVWAQRPSSAPNIIWITGEDMGPQLSCYGFQQMHTPNIDSIASDGVKFTNAFTTAPVCSSSRSAFMTGHYQIYSGAHHHRSHRKDGFQLPPGVRLITDRLRERGYFTCNVGQITPEVKGAGKTDFNFTNERPFDGKHWSERKAGQPVFAHINFSAPHKGPSFPRARKLMKKLVDPASLQLPPYWPDHPTVRDEFANFLDAIHLLDWEVGVTLDALRKDGILDNSLLFFFGDNGRCLIRGKQWLYDAGVHIPVLMRWPGGPIKAGSVRDDMVVSLDFTAESLRSAGVELPADLHGRPLYGPQAKARSEVFTARDRCDMTLDRIRSVRNQRFSYIRNFMPDRPYTQYNEYIERSYPTLGVMKKLHAEGKLDAAQSLFMAPRKPDEELYDLTADPHEVRNLASSAAHAATLKKMREQVEGWLLAVDDKGRHAEAASAAAL
jgi:arylsulfatase A-like enzyme